MRIKKKIGIGFGIIILLFVVLVIESQMWWTNLTPEERQQIEEKRVLREQQAEKERLEREAKEDQEKAKREQEELQKKISEEQNRKEAELIELEKKKQAERDAEAEARKLDTEEEVVDFMQNYKGKDNAGPTLARTFEVITAVTYPNENIFASPSTTVSMFAYKDFDTKDFNRYWKVELEIKTYRETAYYEWVVDTETNLVYPGNAAGGEILDILDIFDK